LVFAHELLPKSVIEYVENNPNASAEEIKKYFAQENPELYENFSEKNNIIDSVRGQNTTNFDIIRDFVGIGFTHILGGLDHILFVITLLLAFVSFREVLKLTAAFTIAHSITLILAAGNIFTLPSYIVEPLIALSIAYLAITTIFFAKNKILTSTKAKLFTVFGFGLFHGLGFAGILREISIPGQGFLTSLVSFNIGIELGQIAIILIALPVIYLLRNKKWYPVFIKVIAIIVSCVAIFWFFQRIV